METVLNTHYFITYCVHLYIDTNCISIYTQQVFGAVAGDWLFIVICKIIFNSANFFLIFYFVDIGDLAILACANINMLNSSLIQKLKELQEDWEESIGNYKLL